MGLVRDSKGAGSKNVTPEEIEELATLVLEADQERMKYRAFLSREKHERLKRCLFLAAKAVGTLRGKKAP